MRRTRALAALSMHIVWNFLYNWWKSTWHRGRALSVCTTTVLTAYRDTSFERSDRPAWREPAKDFAVRRLQRWAWNDKRRKGTRWLSNKAAHYVSTISSTCCMANVSCNSSTELLYMVVVLECNFVLRLSVWSYRYVPFVWTTTPLTPTSHSSCSQDLKVCEVGQAIRERFGEGVIR